jgi:hypothetical protein
VDPYGRDVKIPAVLQLGATDATEPVMAMCRILDEADSDLYCFCSGSGKPAYTDTPDGLVVTLPRFGAQCYLPYEARIGKSTAPDFVAAADESDEAASCDYSPTLDGHDARAPAVERVVDDDDGSQNSDPGQPSMRSNSQLSSR